MYEDATANGNANMEVAKARGTADTLSERLAGVDYELAQARNDISTQYNRLDSIIAQAGDGSVPTELTDMRVGANNITYATSGAAVRGQLANLFERLDATDELLGRAVYTIVDKSYVKKTGNSPLTVLGPGPTTSTARKRSYRNNQHW